jgi:hypothetical protein
MNENRLRFQYKRNSSTRIHSQGRTVLRISKKISSFPLFLLLFIFLSFLPKNKEIYLVKVKIVEGQSVWKRRNLFLLFSWFTQFHIYFVFVWKRRIKNVLLCSNKQLKWMVIRWQKINFYVVIWQLLKIFGCPLGIWIEHNLFALHHTLLKFHHKPQKYNLYIIFVPLRCSLPECIAQTDHTHSLAHICMKHVSDFKINLVHKCN